jgi:hypothetical protein
MWDVRALNQRGNGDDMRRLIAIFAMGVFLSVAGLASAEGAPPAAPDQGITQNAGPAHWFAGTVTAVGASSLSVGVLWTGPNDGSLNSQTVNVNVVTQTRINQGPHHRAIALASISTGDLVAVRATGDASSFTARRIHVFCNCHWIGGTVNTVGPTSFSVDVKRTGPYDTVLDSTTVTLQTDQYTVYLRGHRRARIGLSDLKPGEGVGVVFASDGFFKAPGFDPAKATFTAKRVHAWAHRQVPPASTDAGVSASVAT